MHSNIIQNQSFIFWSPSTYITIDIGLDMQLLQVNIGMNNEQQSTELFFFSGAHPPTCNRLNVCICTTLCSTHWGANPPPITPLTRGDHSNTTLGTWHSIQHSTVIPSAHDILFVSCAGECNLSLVPRTHKMYLKISVIHTSFHHRARGTKPRVLFRKP